ncbi:ankyrin repeat-containing domain protein [Xylariaceae sp. FL0016]|nr:ankyrin repeat-containing domain protein [Xylariaceae sp. FL0016]
MVLDRDKIVQWILELKPVATVNACSHVGPFTHGLVQLATHFLSSGPLFGVVLDHALECNLSWVDGQPSPLHVALLDRKPDFVAGLLRHLEEHLEYYQHAFNQTSSGIARGRSSRLSVVSYLVNQRAGATVEGKVRHVAPLHIAVGLNNLDTAQLLIRYGADVDGRDATEDQTPLMIAVQYGSRQIVEFLIESGAHVGLFDRKGQQAIHYALRRGDRMTIDALVSAGGDPLVFIDLVSEGVDPFHIDRLGTSALRQGLLAIVGLWPYGLTSGLAIQAMIYDDDVFHTALYHLSPRVTKKLYRLLPSGSASCNVDYPRSHGRNSLICVVSWEGNLEKLKTLLDLGADMSREGSPYGSPLMAACVHGRLEIVKFLVHRGAAIEYVNEHGEYRNAFEAARHHPEIRDWFLRGRFIEQPKLASEGHWPEAPLQHWSGIGSIRVRLRDDQKRQWGESGFGYLLRLQRWKRAFLTGDEIYTIAPHE